jgi:hypothetical protein
MQLGNRRRGADAGGEILQLHRYRDLDVGRAFVRKRPAGRLTF